MLGLGVAALLVSSVGAAPVPLHFGTGHRLGWGASRLASRQQSLAHLSPANACPGVDELYYSDAVVDNFAPIAQQKKWAEPGQRYWTSSTHWGGPGFPVFVWIGGEGTEACSRLTGGLNMVNLAQKHQALLINIEHRFYGASYPTADMSTANLEWLSSEQALADVARLVSSLKAEYETETSKVVTFGGSYPGCLSAWMRLKYPALVQGAIASSAPLLAKLDMSEYMEVVSNATVEFTGKTSCNSALEAAAIAVSLLASQGVGSVGMQKLEKDFNTCGPIASELDLAVLLSDLMGNIQGVVQYNNPNPGYVNVDSVCQQMLAGSDAYAQFVALSLQFKSGACEDASWDDTVTVLSRTANDGGNAMRAWTYQTCSEFGYYQTTNSEAQPFSSWKQLNLGFFREICRAAFDGWSVDPETAWKNEEYGATAIDATNIVFGAGTVDPWHALGVTNATKLAQPSEVAAFMKGTSHCRDLYAPSDSDPADVKWAHAKTAEAVEAWVGAPAAKAESAEKLIAESRRRSRRFL